MVLLGLLKMEDGASSKGEGSGEDVASDDDEETSVVDDGFLGDSIVPESAVGVTPASLPASELARRTSMSLVSCTGLGSRFTRSNCLVKYVTGIGACRSSAINCTSCSTSPVKVGIVGDAAGTATMSLTVTSSGWGAKSDP